MQGFVAEIGGIELPAKSPHRRTAPRPIDLRDERYDALFDWTWLFYDVFQSANRVMMPGPPLRNLADLVVGARVLVDGHRLDGPLETIEMDRCQRSSILVEGHADELAFDAGTFVRNVRVQANHCDVFAQHKVLLTINRDNDLRWIADWVEFHVKAHGVDGVLIYDNGSTRYGTGDLLACIQRVRGVRSAIIVPWPYSFGPQGSREAPWDSDYCQYVSLEHARYRFLMRATAVLQLDVDELVVCESGRGVFSHLEKSPTGALSFAGRWLEAIPHPANAGPPRHMHYRYMGKGSPPCAPKWAVVPARIPDSVQWKVHLLEPGFIPDRNPGVVMRHFKAISTNWKYRRTDPPAFDPLQHVPDRGWVRQMRAIGWARIELGSFVRRWIGRFRRVAGRFLRLILRK